MQRHYLTSSTGTIEVTDRVDRVGWELTEKAEEGSVGSGTQTFDDPDMDFAPEPWRRYTVLEDESEATDNVLFDGFITDQIVARVTGTRREPIRRAWSIGCVDKNAQWNTRVMVGADCRRPAETDTTRMAWLLTTSEASYINDAASYVSTASATAMDKVDYTGQYLNQIVEDASQHTGKNWWLQGQETGAGRVVVAWYGRDGLTAYTSPLFLTNDLADLARVNLENGTSLGWPIGAADKLAIDPSRLYTGVYLRYRNGTRAIYRRNPDTTDVDSPLYHVYRDFIADYPNVKTKAKAEIRATRLLADLATPDDVITATVELPKGKATMIRAGMRIACKFTHMPGYESYRRLRVVSCTVSPVSSGEKYLLNLDLKGPGVAGGGPALPPGPAYANTYTPHRGGTYRSEIGVYIVTWDDDGDDPASGETSHPLVGALAYETVSAPWTGIRVTGTGTVSVRCTFNSSAVISTSHDFIGTIRLNGAMIAQQTFSKTTSGLVGFGASFDMTALDVAVVPGDLFEATVSLSPLDHQNFWVLPQGSGNLSHALVVTGSLA